MSGVAVDAMNPNGRPSVDELAPLGVDGIRIVAFDEPQFFAYVSDLAVSLRVAVVIARESCDDDDYAGWGSYYAERCTPQMWICGNEPDAYLLPAESPSSWSMRPAEYVAFWAELARGIRARQPDARLVVAGLVSGQPSWVGSVAPLLDPPPYGFDIHPYGKDAEETRRLLQLYREALAGY